MDSLPVCRFLLFSVLLFCTSGVTMAEHDDFKHEFLERDDMFDKLTRKLKPVRQVIEDHKDGDHELPRIRDCGPDETQNWYEPDPEDCSCYFVCTGKYYVHRKCTQGLHFDMNETQCKWPEEVDCGDRQLPFTPQVYQGPQQYNFDQFTNTKEDQQQSNNKDRWLFIDKIETDDEAYEYFM